MRLPSAVEILPASAVCEGVSSSLPSSSPSRETANLLNSPHSVPPSLKHGCNLSQSGTQSWFRMSGSGDPTLSLPCDTVGSLADNTNSRDLLSLKPLGLDSNLTIVAAV